MDNANEGFRAPKAPASSAAPAQAGRGRGRSRFIQAKQETSALRSPTLPMIPVPTRPPASAVSRSPTLPMIPMPTYPPTPAASGSVLYSAIRPEKPRDFSVPVPIPQAIPTRGIIAYPQVEVTDRARKKNSRKLAEELDEAFPTADHWKRFVASMNVRHLPEGEVEESEGRAKKKKNPRKREKRLLRLPPLQSRPNEYHQRR
ncbi:hypothetical protein BDP27DRAFT_1447231 [Rhodocollybia butyracea]|uniref:Uncharacterized protein n=1 Tax=Rhodocollybia butyracea TaxID=206335 RepID=A0A9P5U9L3_9AGAR|nr:hypothetical protein BDP27DRAFT_1447231 [Rhodocollybia butyracea]